MSNQDPNDLPNDVDVEYISSAEILRSFFVIFVGNYRGGPNVAGATWPR